MLGAEPVEFAACGTTAHDGRPIAGGIPPYTCHDASDRMSVWAAFTNNRPRRAMNWNTTVGI
jgi:hypothetical protein